MRAILLPALSLVSLVALRGPATAQEDAKATVEKAIKAHGGEEKLNKYPASQIKAKGNMNTMGADIEFTVEAASQLPDKMHNEIKLEVMGQALTVIQVYDGKQGWVSVMGQVTELEGDQLDEMKEQMFSDYLDNLVPLLKDKSLKLEVIGDEKVDGKPAAGVKVSAKGHKDTKMYFDKETGLLVKSERRALDDAMQEVNAETFYRDYKDVSGVKQPMKVLVKHDGKKYMDVEVTEVKLLEKLDDSLFKKPE
jgi:hypothetical protein